MPARKGKQANALLVKNRQEEEKEEKAHGRDGPMAAALTRHTADTNRTRTSVVKLRVRNVTRRRWLSGGLRCLLLCNVLCLRAFLALDYFKFNVIAFLQAFVTLGLDGAVVDKHIGAVFPANKAEALCVVKPFHFTFNSRHDPFTLQAVLEDQLLPGLIFMFLVSHS